MDEFEADDADDDEHDGDKADDVRGVAKENNTREHGSCGADTGPYSVSRTDRDCFHGLRDGKKAENDEDDSDDAGNEFAKAAAVFKSDGKANLKKARK